MPSGRGATRPEIRPSPGLWSPAAPDGVRGGQNGTKPPDTKREQAPDGGGGGGHGPNRPQCPSVVTTPAPPPRWARPRAGMGAIRGGRRPMRAGFGPLRAQFGGLGNEAATPGGLVPLLCGSDGTPWGYLVPSVVAGLEYIWTCVACCLSAACCRCLLRRVSCVACCRGRAYPASCTFLTMDAPTSAESDLHCGLQPSVAFTVVTVVPSLRLSLAPCVLLALPGPVRTGYAPKRGAGGQTQCTTTRT